MKITAVDPFYLKIPEVTDAADGTQDTVLIRVRTDAGLEGWGECDASPLVTMAAYCCPMSHGNIINVRASLLGETLNGPDDVRRLHAKMLRNGLDIAQIHHAVSGADIALWDLVGQRLGKPIHALLDDGPAHPKLPYGSVLFGDTPQATFELAHDLRRRGYHAAKFGWGPMGKAGEAEDVALVEAARAGLDAWSSGDGEPRLMVDAGVAWGEDWETAYARAIAFAPYRLTWLEEPLSPDAVEAYGKLTGRRPPVPIAAGEGSGYYRAAEDLALHGGVRFLQIDAGRIGGITVSHRVRKLAEARGTQFVNHTFKDQSLFAVPGERESELTGRLKEQGPPPKGEGMIYVNHTFKSHLSLAAAIHVFAAVERFQFLEYPGGGSDLATRLTTTRLEPGPDGLVRAPTSPGLGVRPDLDCVREYLQPVKIEVAGEVRYQTPSVDD
jgi:L-alanine-DL-glutamate epimerase-like enolase superfamily enzyme